MKSVANLFLWMAAACCVLGSWATPVQAQQAKPNILVIWGDDIGQFNVGAYNNGMMGYKTPNTDRIRQEGSLAVAYILLNLPATNYFSVSLVHNLLNIEQI